jgi:hypothetical protein
MIGGHVTDPFSDEPDVQVDLCARIAKLPVSGGEPHAAPFPAGNPDPREPVRCWPIYSPRDEAQKAALDVLARELDDAYHPARHTGGGRRSGPHCR